MDKTDQVALRELRTKPSFSKVDQERLNAICCRLTICTPLKLGNEVDQGSIEPKRAIPSASLLCLDLIHR